eukprot:Filipodium_phascolosomae@DN1651_c0_g1_i1.p1
MRVRSRLGYGLFLVNILAVIVHQSFNTVSAQPSTEVVGSAKHPCSDPWDVLSDERTTCLFEISLQYDFDWLKFPVEQSNNCVCDSLGEALEAFRCCEESFVENMDAIAEWLLILPSHDSIVQLCTLNCKCKDSINRLLPPTATVGNFSVTDMCAAKEILSSGGGCCEGLTRDARSLSTIWGMRAACDSEHCGEGGSGSVKGPGDTARGGGGVKTNSTKSAWNGTSTSSGLKKFSTPRYPPAVLPANIGALTPSALVAVVQCSLLAAGLALCGLVMGVNRRQLVQRESMYEACAPGKPLIAPMSTPESQW